MADESYELAVIFCPDAVAVLPQRSALVQQLELAKRTKQFNACLMVGDIEGAQRILKAGVEINKPVILSHGIGEASAIHYAARLGSIEGLRLVVDAGAEVNALNPDGKSPMRLVAEQPSIARAARAEALAFLRQRGGHIRPEITSTWRRFQTWLGFRLAPR